MARKLRLEYEGAIYHVMNRGDRREPIFKDDADRKRFLETLAECCGKTDWQVHAFCLMSNHFHLVVETPKANLVAAGQPLRSYRWSSYPWYLASPGKRPRWLQTGRLLGEHGIPRDSKEGRREFGRQMERHRQSENEPEQYKPLRRGWCFGDRRFRKELLGQMAERVGESHYGAERQESGEEKAERIVEEELKRRRWTESSLQGRRKSDPEKVKIALRLRRESIMTLKWIAQRLQMGSWTNVSNCLASQSK